MVDYIWHDENYDKRIKLTVDNSKVAGDLENFPVLFHLSNDSGISGVDTTCVFDELTSSGIDYTTWNPDDKHANITLSNGNLTATATNTALKSVRAGHGKSSGKWYWEVKIDVAASAGHLVGAGTSSATLDSYVGNDVYGYSYYGLDGDKRHNSDTEAYGSTYGLNNVIGVALDLDNGKIWFSKNGVWQASGDPAAGTNEAYSGLSGTFYPMYTPYQNTDAATAKFDSSDLTYSAPSGFTAGISYSCIVSNNKKIAIYTEQGVQRYTEIEDWDWENEKANLWVKIPTVTSGTNTELYLYYDKDHVDNTTYIGDTGDSAAQNVWDDNFKGVWHMSQDPTGVGYCMLDSTSNGHHGDPQSGLGSDDLVDGKVGKAIEFDGVGVGDRIDFQTSSDFAFGTNDFTIEHIVYPISNGTIWCNYEAANKLHVPYFDSSTSAKVLINGADNITGITTIASVFQQFMAVRTGNDLKVYINNVKSGTTGNVAGVSVGEDTTNFIGCSTSSAHAFSGRVDEVRISNIARSAAWMKASYYSSWDDLITFGVEENKPAFIFNGYVKVGGDAAARVVYLYRRSSGELVGSVVSNENTGYFEVVSCFNDYHFVNVLPELTDDYNIIVKDKIHPEN